jgi:hypothetical protein
MGTVGATVKDPNPFSSKVVATSVVENTKTKTTLETKEELGDLTIYDGPIGEITVEAGMTKNLGDYNSARFMVSLKVPTNLDALDKTFAYARDWVDAKLQSLLAE